MSSELYACLCVREFPAQALLRLRPQLRGCAVAVMDGKPPMQQACSLNQAAQLAGAEIGMTQVEIETLPQVACLARSSAEEAGAISALLAVISAFSPRMEIVCEDATFLCIADIGGTEKLLGCPKTVGKNLLERARHMGIEGALAISEKFHAAVCLARGASVQQQLQTIPSGNEAAALAPLPLDVLCLQPALRETFTSWGIRTLGELARLPEDELIARIGQQGSELHQKALGTCPHLFVPQVAAFSLQETMELDSPVELLEPLLFVLSVMLEQLILRGAARAQALASVTVALALENKLQHTRTVRPVLPSNERELWLKLLHLDLQANPPSAAVLSLHLTAEAGATPKMQMGLFSPQLPEPMRLDVVLARIRAMVGESRVGRAVLFDTNQPDAFRVQRFQVPSATNQKNLVRPRHLRSLRVTGVAGGLQPRRLLSEGHGFSCAAEVKPSHCAQRRLRPPELSSVILKDGEPANFTFRDKCYQVAHAYGPWLTSGEWWNPQLWSTEQWDVIAAESGGEKFCGCLAQDALRNQWHVVTLYD